MGMVYLEFVIIVLFYWLLFSVWLLVLKFGVLCMFW